MQVNELLKLMIDRGASDLHLMVSSPPVLRIDGKLMLLEDLEALSSQDMESAFEQVSNQEQLTAFGKVRELDFPYSTPGLARFRVNALRQRGTISLVFHTVPSKAPSVDELGLPEICKQLILKPRGLILITGAAGNGKSTTLAAMINHLNETERRNVITVEDPIEFLFRNNRCLIRQRDLGDDTDSFSSALIHALRHDPDVLVIGEMRDLPTISTAMRAAQTGHLVVGTMHANDAAQSIDRIIDMFPYGQQQQMRLQLSQVIEAVLSQVLLTRIAGGRIAAFEIMIGTSIIRRQIRDEKIHEILANIEVSKPEGMQSLDQALADLVRRNVITEEEAVIKSSHPAKLQKFLQS